MNCSTWHWMWPPNLATMNIIPLPAVIVPNHCNVTSLTFPSE
ncbi:hypothetical protein ACLETV_23225 [Citrobacter braakii]